MNHLIGMKFEEAEAMLRTRGRKLRRYNSNSLITANYDEDRMNVETNENDIITAEVGLG